jgi:hypothetical protein
MERFMPISPEILTRVILLYEKEFKYGIRVWEKIKENESSINSAESEDPLKQELARWMEQLQAIFANTEPFREKEKWMNDPVQLN